MTLDELREILIGDYMQRHGMAVDDAVEHVDKVIAAMERVAPGARIHVAKRRALPVAEIRKAMNDGASVRELERRFHADRRTIYRALDDA